MAARRSIPATLPHADLDATPWLGATAGLTERYGSD